CVLHGTLRQIAQSAQPLRGGTIGKPVGIATGQRRPVDALNLDRIATQQGEDVYPRHQPLAPGELVLANGRELLQLLGEPARGEGGQCATSSFYLTALLPCSSSQVISQRLDVPR